MGGEERSELPLASETDEEIALDTIPLHSTNLLTVLDPDGVVQYESPSIERVYGFAQDDLVGEQVAEYFHPDDRERVVEAFQAVVAGDGDTVQSVEYRHERADGSYVWVESITSADPTPQGYYVVNTRDISSQKEREQELAESNERLEAFADAVSHDLRNPLNVAIGRMQLLREECDSEHLDAVANAHDRMEALIEDLLTLARSDNRIDETEWVDLATLVDTCWQTVSTADATLDIDVDRSIRADRSRLRQLLENLVRNAVEHGGEDVTVSIGELETRDGFYVVDDGRGIAQRERERVFESGYSTGDGGTGMGLAIVREIATAHDWRVELTDGSDGGARFEVTGVDVR